MPVLEGYWQASIRARLKSKNRSPTFASYLFYHLIRFLTRHYLFMADTDECSGGSGMLGIPMTVKEVKPEHLKSVFPPNDILTKWHAGEDADWPPLDEDYELDEDNMPRLRFGLGQRVQCRIGPDAVTGWASGTVMLLWYREASWPPGSMAPYQVQLDDGRMIFAPQDVEQVIRSGPQNPAASQATALPANSMPE